MNRIKSLDGLRALSIIMVILRHSSRSLPSVIGNNQIYSFFANASLGVHIFFVISGYLITKLLLIEKEKTNTISISAFYKRRILRIFPVFYLYILVIMIIKYCFVSNIYTLPSLPVYASTFSWNYFYSHITHITDTHWIFGHFWSLSMEEQFYLIWPFLTFKLNRNTQVKLTIIVILLMPVLRCAYMFAPINHTQILYMLHTGGDTILVGCLLALVENSKNMIKPFQLMRNPVFIFVVFILLFFINPYIQGRYKWWYVLSVGVSLENILIVILLWWSINVPGIVSRILNHKSLAFIGVLSYSLYIWQQLIFDPTIKIPCPLNYLALLAVAIFSYYLVEKPILNLKKRFSAVKHP